MTVVEMLRQHIELYQKKIAALQAALDALTGADPITGEKPHGHEPIAIPTRLPVTDKPLPPPPAIAVVAPVADEIVKPKLAGTVFTCRRGTIKIAGPRMRGVLAYLLDHIGREFRKAHLVESVGNGLSFEYTDVIFSQIRKDLGPLGFTLKGANGLAKFEELP